MDDVKYAQNKVNSLPIFFPSDNEDSLSLQIIDVLEYNMPAGGGFSAGLIAGFRS